MNNKIFKNEPLNINKLLFFMMKPSHSISHPKNIITHFITGNKLYEIMKNHLPRVRWNKNSQSVRYYSVFDKNPPPKFKKYRIRHIRLNETHNFNFYRERNGIEILNPFKNFRYDSKKIFGIDLNNVNIKFYKQNGRKNVKQLKKSCKQNQVKGYSRLTRKELIWTLMKI